MKTWLTVAEGAEYSGVSRDTIYTACERRELTISTDPMSELYPLLLLPEFYERVWGTRDLSLIYPHKTARQGGEFDKPIGEAWLTGDHCKVANVRLAGKSLSELSQQYGRE